MSDKFIHPETGEELEASPFKTGKPHISFSELTDWIQCPFRHKLKHIDHHELTSDVPTPHLGFGTGVHDSIEHYLPTRIMDKEIAFETIRKSWHDNEKLFMEGPFPSWAPKGFGAVDNWLEKANRILEDVPTFLDKEFPGWTCYKAEELLYEGVVGHKVFFKGYVDAVITMKDKRGNDKYVILDWKTCGWGWPKKKKEDFNVQLQLILYKNYWAQKNKIDPKLIKCYFGLLKRDGKPGDSVALLPVSVGPVTTSKGLKIIDSHVRATQRGFFPKNRDSCTFCEFQGTEACPPNR